MQACLLSYVFGEGFYNLEYWWHTSYVNKYKETNTSGRPVGTDCRITQMNHLTLPKVNVNS